MPKQVRAYGQILSFSDEMTDAQMAKAIMDNEHLLNPDYKQPSPELLDYAKGFAVGSNKLVSGIGALAEIAGAEETGKAIRSFGDQGAEYWNQKMSAGGKAAASEQVFEDDENSLTGVRLNDKWATALLMGASQSAPSMLAAALPGAAITKGITKGVQLLARLGLAGGAGATIPLLTGTAAPLGLGSQIVARAPSAIGFGAAEGIVAGGMNAASLKTSIESMSDAELSKSPVYAALKSKYGQETARQMISDQAAIDLFGKTALSTGTIGALTGGGALGQAYQKIGVGSQGGVFAQIGKGGALEFMQETPQSGAETYIENLTKKKYLDESIDPTKGVVSSALTGGSIGAFTGGVIGGAGAVNIGTKNNLSGKREAAKKTAQSINQQTAQKDVSDITNAQSVDEAINAASKAAARKPVTENDIHRSEDPTLADIERVTGLKPTEAIDQAISEAETLLNVGQSEGEKAQPAAKQTGVDTDIVLPDGSTLKAQWDVVDADAITASLKEGVNQPRDRTRLASDMQVQSIANNPDYRRLADSPVMDVGAPVLSSDGLIVAGNGRFEGVSRAHEQGTAKKYIDNIKADAAQKGIDPALIDGMRKPVLVRRITQPFDVRKVAIASNSGTSLQYSGLELAKIDADRMQGIEDLDVNDLGDISLTADNLTKLKQSLRDYNATELAAITDKSGMLSQDGVRRVRNALLAKAYGGSDALGRLVESTDPSMRNVLGALTKSAQTVAKARAHIKAGYADSNIDVTDNLLNAVHTFALLRAKNQPLDNYLAQQNLFGDKIDGDTREILQFLHDNVRSQRRLASFIKGVFEQISGINKTTNNIFGEDVAPTKQELIANAKDRTAEEFAGAEEAGADSAIGKPDAEVANAQTNNAGSSEEGRGDDGAKFFRSAEERLKDRERSRQLERKLRDQGYDHTIEARDVRDFAAMDRSRQNEAIAAEQIARVFGKRVVWIKAKGSFDINGVVVPSIKDTIFIDVDTKKYAHAVMGHELSHHMEYDTPAVYRDLVKSLEGVIKNHDEYAKKYDIKGADKDYLTKEIVGDIMGDNFADPKFWDKVAAYNPNTFRRIADAIVSWIKRLLVNAKARGLGSEQWVTDAQKAQDIVANAVAKYADSDSAFDGLVNKPLFSRMYQGLLFDDEQNDTPEQKQPRLRNLFDDEVATDAATDDKPKQSQLKLEASVVSEQDGSGSERIDDFGQKLGGARKDMAAAMRKEYSDSDIASLPLSKIWPASEVDAIDDKYIAAIAFTARAEIPAKPRVSYKVAPWVEKVKMLRSLTSFILDGELTKEQFKEKIGAVGSLKNIVSKIDLLERIDRSQWKRIDSVAEYPNAFGYNEDGIKYSSPEVSVHIDGRYHRFGGNGTIASVIDEINGVLNKEPSEAKEKRMQFEVRGREGYLFINKKGDREYRKLKTFTSTKEAFNYIKNNYDELVEAWEAVKESDNVKKSDIRRDENRPRTGQNWRDGKDVTPEQFGSQFGSRGVEFGNWVSQGGSAKERQGMLNEAYDALMDLSNIVGVPPKALSLNGSLGLGFGSRGKGSVSAHFEPDMLVINLTKTRGSGSLAHEWFHALDNYFQRERGSIKSAKSEDYYITYKPERLYVRKDGKWAGYKASKQKLSELKAIRGGTEYDLDKWMPDPSHPLGVRPEVEAKFADLVDALNKSPMTARSSLIDKGAADGYWSRIIERAARSFENYVIAKMMRNGYHNDYLANVVSPEAFSRDKGRYPYLLESELAPVEQAFDSLFGEIKYKETDKGVALFSRASKTDSIPETINIDGVDRPTRNSEGKLIHPTEEGIRNFWKWFSGSKVVDEQGRPRVVYHGTNNKFYEVDLGRGSPSVFWFSSDKQSIMKGESGAQGTNNIMELYVRLTNPVGYEEYDRLFVDQYKTEGFDGAILDNSDFEFDGFVLDKNQVKSISNTGAFSDNPDIRFSFAGEKSETAGQSTSNAQKTILIDNQIEPELKNVTAAEGASPKQVDEFGIPKETKFQKFQREWQNDFNRFAVIKDWLKSRGVTLSEKADVSLAEERFHARVANQKEDFRDFVVNPLIQKIAAAGYKMGDIADYLEAQHAKEANAQIRRLHDTNDPEVTAYGISDEEAERYLVAAPKELGNLANEFRDITERTKQLRLDGGLLNKDITDAWEATYQYYIPVKGNADQQKGTGKGLAVNFKSKRRLGHGRRDEAVIENILYDHERAILEVEKNRVAKHLAMMAAEIATPELMTIDKPVKRNVLRNATAYEVQVKGVTRAVFDSREAAQVYKSSLPLFDKKIASGEIVIVPSTDQRVVAMASPMLADNEINAYIDGHAIRIQINDEISARAYKKLGIEGYGKLVSAGRALNGYLSKVYTGYNPEFIMVNMVRDFTAGIMNLTGEEGLAMAGKAIKNYPGAFASLLRYAISNRTKSTEWIDAYRASGGNTGAAYLSDMERLGNDIATEYAAYQGAIANLKEGKPLFAARAAGRKVFNVFLKWIYNMNQAGENAMRLAAFKAMIDSGKTKNEAAHVAKNITVNFNRKGENGAIANAAWLFFNASVQGQAATFHALFKGKHNNQAWALAVGMSTIGYLLASSFGGGDEDDYDKIDDYTKERNVVIKHGDGWVKIPVPYGYGFFYNLGRAMADAQRKNDFGLVPWHLTASAIEELTPFGDVVTNSDEGFNLDQVFMGTLPTALKIPGQVATNKQLFSGSEIMPESPFDKSQPDRDKMWRTTKGTIYDEIAGYLEMAGLDVSPETLKYSFRTATGGAGALVDTGVSAAMLKSGGAELEPQEVPFLRKIYHENTVREDRAAFQKTRLEAQKAAEEFARAMKKQDFVTAKEIAQDKNELIALDRYADKLQKVVKVWRDEQDKIRLDKTLSAGEKRIKLKELEAKESKLYDDYLNAFKKYKSLQ